MLIGFDTLVFYTFAVITVLAGLSVITARNPVHAALFLVLAFCSAAGVWILLEAEFLAITLVLGLYPAPILDLVNGHGPAGAVLHPVTGVEAHPSQRGAIKPVAARVDLRGREAVLVVKLKGNRTQ